MPTSPTSRHRHQHKDMLPPLAHPLRTSTDRGCSWTVTATEADDTGIAHRGPGAA
ncbi:hypothetical protein [Streptomyces mirabilis]|uniref:hypothetical protein n=1 Tax=Streptomyces mirabilis TaxID=68239 RepID=UPI00341B9E40